MPDGSYSLRGIGALRDLEELYLPTGVRLDPIPRLPALRALHLNGSRVGRTGPRRERVVRLGPLARAPRLEELVLHDHVVALQLEALASIPTLRVVDLSFLEAPDLGPLASLPLRRLVLDGVRGVDLARLEGLAVEQLDLWGCDLDDLAPLATMPNLREVWINDAGCPRDRPGGALAFLMHVRDGARLVLDDSFRPDLEPDRVAELEARGVTLFVASRPHDHGVQPSWWGGTGVPSPPEDRCEIRYASPGFVGRPS